MEMENMTNFLKGDDRNRTCVKAEEVPEETTLCRRSKHTSHELFPGHPLPSKQSLVSAFVEFGPVLEPLTQFTRESTAQVIFLQGDSAKAAFNGLERSNSFGPALATFWVLNNRPVEAVAAEEASSSGTRTTSDVVLPLVGTPNLHDMMYYMKNKMEMVRDILEREGHTVHTIDPEMRARLETARYPRLP
ncbi:unnamed protein product [Cuscuta epithymum]|uniref:Uncharacterized protein n=1 Tax=Cuscuta epithymum TaxID=186058 RepID=A0AAV0FN64_9ASTE|nr:unnamed protein product [Cuscuta epithymum]